MNSSIVHTLLAKGYFPKELPPVFTTHSFADFAVTTAGSAALDAYRPVDDFTECSEVRVARTGNESRDFKIPHPYHFAKLAKLCATEFSKLLKLGGASPFSSSIPTYGTTGLTEEIVSHLVECRVRRVVLMLDADEAGRAAAVEMAQRLAAVNIEAGAVELPAKDAAEFIGGGGTADDVRRIITASVKTKRMNREPRCKLRRATTGRCCLRLTAVSIAFGACRRWAWSG